MKVKENLEHILKELQDATFKIEEEQIENVLKLIAPDKKIFLTGKGRSGLAAKGFANRLMHLGFQAYVIGEISTPHTKAGDLIDHNIWVRRNRCLGQYCEKKPKNLDYILDLLQ